MPVAHTPTSLCRFGLARCDITSPVGIYHRMWGAATHDRSTGVHRPLTATAMALHPAAGDVRRESMRVVIAVDHCLLWGREMADLLTALCQSTGLTDEQILVAFSHTHAAGLMGRERAHLPGGELIGPYLDSLAQRLGDIVLQAERALTPAVITYGVGRCNLAAQRDFWDGDTKQYVCGFNPDATADDTVLIARVTEKSGKALATIVNYACHPTTLAWGNTLISPDYPGAMREVIEQATGVPCAFLQGASGDLGPREGFVGETAVADRNGRQLGHAVLSTLAAMPPPLTCFRYAGPVISGATIGTWQHTPVDDETPAQAWDWRQFTVDLPYRADLPNKEETLAELATWRRREEEAGQDALARRDAHAMIERLTRRLTRIQYLPPGANFPMLATLGKFGAAVWLFVEGEHYQWLQTTLRQRFPTTPIVVTTLANGSRCSYLPTAETYGKGIYQESIAVLDKGCLEMLAETIAETLNHSHCGLLGGS